MLQNQKMDRLLSCFTSKTYPLNIVFFLLCTVCACSGSTVTTVSDGLVTPEPTPISRTFFIDGNAVTGLNHSTAVTARKPVLATNNSKLYLVWKETNGTKTQIRAKVNRGTDEAPDWASVDGGLSPGLNKLTAQNADNPHLISFNSKLYAIWNEETAGTSTPGRIWIAVYNGNDSAPSWSFVDSLGSGLNKDSARNAVSPHLAVFNSKLYAAWKEHNGTQDQVRVAVYNGNDSAPGWTFIEGASNQIYGLNKDPARGINTPKLIASSSKLYATWIEHNGSQNQIRVASFNGNHSAPSWTFIEGASNPINGLNHDPTKNVSSSVLAATNSYLYATWSEYNGTQNQIRVAVFNGNDSAPSWTFIEGASNPINGLNKDPSLNVSTPQILAIGDFLYLSWVEAATGYNNEIRLALYNESSTKWSFLDGDGVIGLNYNPAQPSYECSFARGNDSNLYLTWAEYAPGVADQIRVLAGK